MSPKSPQQAFEILKKHLRDSNSHKKGKEKQGSLEAEKNHIVFERLIDRLATSEEKSWALKGGMLMNIRSPEMSRATKDVDITFWNIDKDITYDEIKDMLMKDLAVNKPDFFSFEVSDAKDGKISDKESGTMTATYHIKAMLGKNLVTSFHMDVGVSDKPYNIDNVDYQSKYSDFMGYAALTFPAVSIEQHFAEKLHAYTKPMERFENTRFKDLFDMSVMAEGDIDFERLKDTIKHVFDIRGTHDVPTELSSPPVSWKNLYNKLAKEHGLNETIEESFEKVNAFWSSVLSSDLRDESKLKV